MELRPQPNLQLIYVSDIQRSTAFYKTIFNAEPIFVSPRYVAFAADSKAEALFAIWTGAEVVDFSATRVSEIGIMLTSSAEVELLFKEWQKKSEIKILKEPYTEVFGLTFLVQDPDGHVIRVCPLD